MTTSLLKCLLTWSQVLLYSVALFKGGAHGYSLNSNPKFKNICRCLKLQQVRKDFPRHAKHVREEHTYSDMMLRMSSNGEDKARDMVEERSEAENNVKAAQERVEAAQERADKAENNVKAAQERADKAENNVKAAKEELVEARKELADAEDEHIELATKNTKTLDAEAKHFHEMRTERALRRREFQEKSVSEAEDSLKRATKALDFERTQLMSAAGRLQRAEEELEQEREKLKQAEALIIRRVPFQMPSKLKIPDYRKEFENESCQNVNVVNHGEFERAIEMLLNEVRGFDSDTKRPSVVAVQRCRRGGKTFMLKAIASMLLSDQYKRDMDYEVISISLNGVTSFVKLKEINAEKAILSRIAWEISGRPDKFEEFLGKFSDYKAVDSWLLRKRIILIVDELNIIDPGSTNYAEMSITLNNLVGRKGSGLLFSTHRRSTAEFIRGRNIYGSEYERLSIRNVEWAMIPRIKNENCVQGLQKYSAASPSLWYAVLRGRIPALVVQDDRTINTYGNGIEWASEEERRKCLSAVISGNIEELAADRHLFPAYSYKSERFDNGKDPRYAWPPFLVADPEVIGKESHLLWSTLKSPGISEAKSFEALVQLSVFVRMLTGEAHKLVPLKVNDKEECHAKTEMFHVTNNAKTVQELIESVMMKYNTEANNHVEQVLAVPLFEEFPTYDFFVLHRDDFRWKVAAGYQCKKGSKNPGKKDKVNDIVQLSVWIEGACRQFRKSGMDEVQILERNGWILLGESYQNEMLGVTVQEALPQADYNTETNCCEAARSVFNKKENL